MNEIISINNKIQIGIIDYLCRHKAAQFSDMRPAKIQTNLFSYHVTKLLSADVIKKQNTTYELADKGIQYVHRVLEHPSVQIQPSIKLAFVIQNGDGDVLLRRANEEVWDLPYSVADIDKFSLAETANAYIETLNVSPSSLRHVGDCYLRLVNQKAILDSHLVHVFRLQADDIAETDQRKYIGLHSLGDYKLAPGVEPIMSRTFFGDDFFFEEFEESPLY